MTVTSENLSDQELWSHWHSFFNDAVHGVAQIDPLNDHTLRATTPGGIIATFDTRSWPISQSELLRDQAAGDHQGDDLGRQAHLCLAMTMVDDLARHITPTLSTRPEYDHGGSLSGGISQKDFLAEHLTEMFATQQTNYFNAVQIRAEKLHNSGLQEMKVAKSALDSMAPKMAELQDLMSKMAVTAEPYRKRFAGEDSLAKELSSIAKAAATGSNHRARQKKEERASKKPVAGSSKAAARRQR